MDVDPQFNLTQYCMDEKKYEDILSKKSNGTVHNIFVPSSTALPELLAKKKTKTPVKIIHNLKNKLDIIPSSINLIDFIDQRKSGSERLLINFLEKKKLKIMIIF